MYKDSAFPEFLTFFLPKRLWLLKRLTQENLHMLLVKHKLPIQIQYHYHILSGPVKRLIQCIGTTNALSTSRNK